MPRRKQAAALKPPVVPVDQRLIRFSFEYLDLEHEKFPLEHCTCEYLHALLREILKYQQFTVDVFTQPDPREHRHPIYFPGTKVTEGFHVDPVSEDLWTDAAWQFGLASDGQNHNGWRVHGFLADEIFYLVWLDPNHVLD